MKKDDWIVYIIELSDGSFYTGITNNLENRLKKHSSGNGSKYVLSRLPIVSVVYKENCPNKGLALKREIQIKRMNKTEKIQLTQR